MTSKNFLYSASAFALALQVCASSPSLAMDDKDKDGKKTPSVSLNVSKLSPEDQMSALKSLVNAVVVDFTEGEKEATKRWKDIRAVFPSDKADSSVQEYANTAIESKDMQTIKEALATLEKVKTDFEELDTLKNKLFKLQRSIRSDILNPLAKQVGQKLVPDTLSSFYIPAVSDVWMLYTPIEMLKGAYNNCINQSPSSSLSTSKSTVTVFPSTSSSSSSFSSSSISSSPLSSFVSSSSPSSAPSKSTVSTTSSTSSSSVSSTPLKSTVTSPPSSK